MKLPRARPFELLSRTVRQSPISGNYVNLHLSFMYLVLSLVLNVSASTMLTIRSATCLGWRRDCLAVWTRGLSSSCRSSQHPVSSSGKATASTLADVIDASISATGPLSMAQYMKLSLTHPTLGYYSQGDVFGRKGDFITSPEISQVFGELVAIWLMTRWMAAGSPTKCRLIELGPGRGTLMSDIVRTFQSFPNITVDSIHFVETSLNMRKLQQKALEEQAKKLGAEVTWSDDLNGVPESNAFTMIVAHEFFDALPVHILQRTPEGFREVKVGRNSSYLPAVGNARFSLVVDREPSFISRLLPASSRRFEQIPIGSRLEVSPDSSKAVREMGKLIGNGGAGLVIDYGDDRVFGDSIRAFKNHKIVDFLQNPGQCDLTANVDFAYLRESLEGVARPLGPMTQANFLLSLGLEPRLAKLVSSASNEEQQQRIRDGAMRLINKTGMGNQYRVMGIVPEKDQGDIYPFPAAASKVLTPGSTRP